MRGFPQAWALRSCGCCGALKPAVITINENICSYNIWVSILQFIVGSNTLIGLTKYVHIITELTDFDISFYAAAVHLRNGAPLEVWLKSSRTIAPATPAPLPALDRMTG